jgi:hypothetical protein
MSDRPISRRTGNQAWDAAWDLVCRLGAARDGLVNETVNALPLSARADIDADELAIAIADIEQASAALRRAEPALEITPDRPVSSTPVSGPRSVWTLIGVVWLSTVLVTAGVLFTIASLIY